MCLCFETSALPLSAVKIYLKNRHGRKLKPMNMSHETLCLDFVTSRIFVFCLHQFLFYLPEHSQKPSSNYMFLWIGIAIMPRDHIPKVLTATHW